MPPPVAVGLVLSSAPPRCAAHAPNNASTNRGTKPGSSGVPSIVYDLPLAVWPYAKTVTLYPSSAERISLPRRTTCRASAVRWLHFSCASAVPRLCLGCAPAVRRAAGVGPVCGVARRRERVEDGLLASKIGVGGVERVEALVVGEAALGRVGAWVDHLRGR
jgi:hypothetical protein